MMLTRFKRLGTASAFWEALDRGIILRGFRMYPPHGIKLRSSLGHIFLRLIPTSGR